MLHGNDVVVLEAADLLDLEQHPDDGDTDLLDLVVDEVAEGGEEGAEDGAGVLGLDEEADGGDGLGPDGRRGGIGGVLGDDFCWVEGRKMI